MAIKLASVVLPLGKLSPRGQPVRGLGPIADAIRTAASITSVDEARHQLLAMPEMAEDEEPEGLAWYVFGASVAWLYAADANTTSPADGVIHTFSRVCDLLDAIDGELGDTGLLNQLLSRVSGGAEAADFWAVLIEGVERAADRLRQT